MQSDQVHPALFTIFREQFEPQKLRGHSDKTRQDYRGTLGMLEKFLGRAATTADLNDATACAFLSWHEAKGRSARSVNNRRDYLLAFWRWCARKGLVVLWPDVDELPEPELLPDAWTMDQLAALLAACEEESPVGEISGKLWWTAIHFVWWDTGERTGATLALEWSHFDETARTLSVPGRLRKGGKAAVYTLREETSEKLSALKSLDRGRGDLIFCFPYSRHAFYNRYTRLLARAGLPTDRRCKPQKMRRTFASWLEKNGGDATRALLHTERRVTETSYLDPRIIDRPPANLLLPPLPQKQDADRKGT